MLMSDKLSSRYWLMDALNLSLINFNFENDLSLVQFVVITILRRFGGFEWRQLKEFLTIIFTHSIIQAVTYIEDIGVEMTNKIFSTTFNNN